MLGLDIRSLNVGDLPNLSWTGSKRHLQYVKEWMARAVKGELDVIGLIFEDEIVGLCYIDFVLVEGVGTLAALTIREDLRSRGLGTVLIEASHARVKARGLNAIELRVEKENVRAIELYEKLGYKTNGESVESWEQETKDGQIEIYETQAYIMHKDLS